MKRLLKHWPLAVASAIAFNGWTLAGLAYMREVTHTPAWYTWLLCVLIVYGGVAVAAYPRARKYWFIWLSNISMVFQTDMVIAHVQVKFDLDQRGLLWAFVLIGALGTAKLFFTYWFWGKLVRVVGSNEFVQDAVAFGTEIGIDLKQAGYVDRIRAFVAKRFNWETYKDRKSLRRLKAGGYPAVFLLGIAPLNGTRNPTIIFCKLTNSFSGLCVLAFGALLRIGYLLGGIQLFKMLLS